MKTNLAMLLIPMMSLTLQLSPPIPGHSVSTSLRSTNTERPSGRDGAKSHSQLKQIPIRWQLSAKEGGFNFETLEYAPEHEVVLTGAKTWPILPAADVDIREDGTLVSSTPTDLDFLDHFNVDDSQTADYVEISIDETAVFNWTGQHDFDNGLTTFSFNSWIRGDNTETFSDLVDSLSTNGGVLELGSGEFEIDNLQPDKEMRIIGTASQRLSETSDPLIGAVIKSTNDTGAPALWLDENAKGSRITDLTIRGDDTKLNGSGLRIGKTAAGTMGDINVADVMSVFHDSSGFELFETDGNLLWHTKPFFNEHYGIHVRSRNNKGMMPVIDGGRSFQNGKGGIRIDSHTIPAIWRFEAVQDSTVGIYLHGQAENGNRKAVRGASIIGCDLEPKFQNGTPLSVFRFYNTRNATVANNYVGGGVPNQINGKNLVPRGA